MAASAPGAPARSSADRRASLQMRPLVIRLALYGVLLAIVLAGVPLYILPAQRVPAHADVVFVLGASEPWQITWAQQLVRTGHANTLMISTPAGVEPPSTCAQGALCLQPKPSSTRGEAELLREQMMKHRWRSAIVLTTTPHITRTRFILGQCLRSAQAASVAVIGRATGMGLGDWVAAYVRQSAGFVKAVLLPNC